MLRVNLWASPRNVSTALMYSFAQRSDTQVFDEPLYAHYLRVSGADHPGREAILNSQNNDGQQVIEDMILGQHEKAIAFFKQMTHHLVELNTSFLSQCQNIILIRDPARFISSYIKVIPHPNMADIGIRQQWELAQQLQSTDSLSAVIDARQLLLNPTSVLKKLCQKLDIPFEPHMLEWQPGPIREDGIWAPFWYKTVHASSGFQPFREKEMLIPPHLSELVKEAQFYYEKLLPLAIRA